VNLVAESSGGVYLAMPVDYNEESTPHTNYALGVWVRGEAGDTQTGNRTVLESDTGLMIRFQGKNNGSSADFSGIFPNTKTPDEPYSFVKTGLSGYQTWWKSAGASGPQWVLMGFVKQGQTVYWCASNTVSDTPLGVMDVGEGEETMYLDQLVGDGTNDNSGDETRIGQQLSNGSPLRAYVGGVRIYVIEDDEALGETACKVLWYAMEDEPDAVASSGWTALRSWSFNTFFPNGAFKEHNFPDGNGQDMQLMKSWKESTNFEEGTCPVAYASPSGLF